MGVCMSVELSTPLTVEDIDFRIQSINKGGYATILAYKDARVDMNRLDAVYGPLGWQKKYIPIGNTLHCAVGVWDEKSCQWVWKQDVGTESNTEAAKGQASDAFKRACFNWGIGRELYDYPLIQVKLDNSEWNQDKDRPKASWNLKLKDWRWATQFDGNKLTFIAAKDPTDKMRFKWGEYVK